MEDIRAHRFFDKPSYWQFRAVGQLKVKPVRLTQISIVSFAELIRSARERFPLLTIHREKVTADVCFIGYPVEFTERTFTLENLNCNAEWDGRRRFRFNDVTRVDFGGGYEQMLAATAPPRPRRRT
jgi:hypothetical protein